MKFLLAFVCVCLPLFASAQGAGAQRPGASASENSQPRWRFAAGLGYSLSSKLKFDSGTISSSTASSSLTADFTYKNTYVLDLEAQFMPQNAWGFMGGLQIDGERE